LVDECEIVTPRERHSDSLVSDGVPGDNSDLAAHAEMDDEGARGVERTPDELSPSNRGADRRTRQNAREIRGTSGVTAQRPVVKNSDGLDPRTNEVFDQSATDDFDLGKFGHDLRRQRLERRERRVGLGEFLA
jgi:hypothetical protein